MQTEIKGGIIGITGGIASGKTTVSDYLAQNYGLPILDADLYAREAVQKDGEILEKITFRYGPKILLPDNSLNRPKLAEIIFQDSSEKLWLEKLVHPFIKKRLQEDSQKYPNSLVIMVVPLLFEANMKDLVDQTWLIYCREEQQKHRLKIRNGFSWKQAQQRINSQWSLDLKKKLVDVLIDNTKDLSYLYQQVDRALMNCRLKY